jgi:hypothetical protein
MSLSPNQGGSRPSALVWGGIFVWAMLVAGGMGVLVAYQMHAGRQKIAPQNAPIPVKGRATLLVFIHPMCSCTNATLNELDKIASTNGDKLTIKVLCENLEPQWADSDVVRRAKEIPGVEVWTDAKGELAQKVGALTSGFVVLYDANGRKVFQGGITASRAHEGDNEGEDAIDEFVSKGKIALRNTPTYGCALGTPQPAKS